MKSEALPTVPPRSEYLVQKYQKIQECLIRYSNSENRCLALSKHPSIDYNQHYFMQDLEFFLRTQSMDELEDYLKKHDDHDKKLEELEKIYFPLEQDKEPTKEEKELNKLYRRCLRRYWVYNDRCKKFRFKPWERHYHRKSVEQVEEELEGANMEQLKEFKKELGEKEYQIYRLESLHYPDVVFFYPDREFWMKPVKKIKKIWNGTGDLVVKAKKNITERIKMIGVKCTDV